ncbi:MAG: hypothetical protein AB7V46_21865 [Thermomicrobiales bacterium]
MAVIVVIFLGIGIGCGGDSGPKRLRLWGTANYDGKAIPYGDVLFTPDGTKQNSGPQGIAQIRNGRYDTAGSEGKGFAGGPTVVRVTGLTGPGGKLLCEYEYRVDLPREDGAHNIEVPRQVAPKKGTGPDI